MDLWKQKCILAPSLISCCDLCNLETSVRALETAGIGLLHVDILDGYFSPSMPLGIDTVRQLRKRTKLPFDVHLMASDNDFFVGELLDIGVEQLVFHAETERHIDNRLNQIHAAGARAGVALKPATPSVSPTATVTMEMITSSEIWTVPFSWFCVMYCLLSAME